MSLILGGYIWTFGGFSSADGYLSYEILSCINGPWFIYQSGEESGSFGIIGPEDNW